jgi:hypothetical protein
MKPLESDISRIRAMYRLPTVAPIGRILELRINGSPVFDAVSHPGQSSITCFFAHQTQCTAITPQSLACIADYRKPLPFADSSFDLVVVHEGLHRLREAYPELRDKRALTQLMERMRAVLDDGGVLAGSVANWPAHRWSPKLGHASGNHERRSAHGMSFDSCRRLLVDAGFSNVETFNVLPSVAAPLRLVNTRAQLSRIAFLRELEALRDHLDWPRYALRRLFVQLALNRYVEQSILFWGYKR